MKKTLFILMVSAFFGLNLNAQTKKDGTLDMRYKANKETYGTSYSRPTYSSPKSILPSYSAPDYSSPKTERNYSNGGEYKIQNGYQKSNGTYVAPHLKTSPDNKLYNNYKQRN